VNGTFRFKRSLEIDVVCPESEDGFPVYVPHPTDCSLYYQCIGSNPTLMSCPDGLYFDSSLNVCNWPQFVDCDNGSTEKPETTTDSITTTADLNVTTTITAENETTTAGVNGTYRFKRSLDFDVTCPDYSATDGYAVYIPHPTNCSLYYQCVSNNNYEPTLMSCPDGLYFDSSLNVCNWPQFVDCQNGETNKPESTTGGVDTTTEVLIETSTTFISPNQTISKWTFRKIGVYFL